MVDTKRLRTKIRESGLTIEILSQQIGIDDSTFYRKLQNGGKSFTLDELDRIKIALNLDNRTAEEIFFASSRSTAIRSSSADIADNSPSAAFGPIPLTAISFLYISRSFISRKPYREISSSRTLI